MSDLPDWTRAVAVEVNAEAPTEYWLAKNGTRVMEDATVGNETETMYTVPTGKTLYIVHACLSAYTSGAHKKSYLYTLNADPEIILLANMHVAGEHAHLASKMFLRVLAGEPIKLYAASSTNAFGCFTGYLMEEE